MDLSPLAVKGVSWTENYRYLMQLQGEMHNFIQTQDFELFQHHSKLIEQAYKSVDPERRCNLGGSGGSSKYDWTPAEMERLVQKAVDDAAAAKFQAQLSDYFSDLLSRYNKRDVALIRRRLDEISGVLKAMLKEKVDQIFGGSVAKHTYVDGLSDVDCLLILNDTELHQGGPSSALETVTDALQDGLQAAEVSSGRLAVTVRYQDGMEIQLLPAVRTGERSENSLLATRK